MDQKLGKADENFEERISRIGNRIAVRAVDLRKWLSIAEERTHRTVAANAF